MKKVLAILAIAGAASTAMAQNTGVILTDGDAVFRFGSTTATIIFPTAATQATRLSIDHRVNGGGTGTDLGFDMQWYAGVGTSRTRELSLSGFTSRATTGTNQVRYTFANAFGISGLSAVIDATFTDSAYGPNTSRLFTVLTIVNGTGSTITNLDTFFSIDNDIFDAGNDVAAPLLIDSGDRVLRQSDSVAAGGPFHSTLRGYNADASGVGLFSDLNTQLTDANADFTTLADLNSGGLGVGDRAQMVQWRRTLAPGQVMSYASEVIGAIGANAVIPAPGALALVGLGGLVASRRRRA